jgi:hypothetical protein
VEDIKAVTGSQSRTNRVKEVFLSQDPSPEIRQAAVAAMAEMTAFSPSIQSASLHEYARGYHSEPGTRSLG